MPVRLKYCNVSSDSVKSNASTPGSNIGGDSTGGRIMLAALASSTAPFSAPLPAKDARRFQLLPMPLLYRITHPSVLY